MFHLEDTMSTQHISMIKRFLVSAIDAKTSSAQLANLLKNKTKKELEEIARLNKGDGSEQEVNTLRELGMTLSDSNSLYVLSLVRRT